MVCVYFDMFLLVAPFSFSIGYVWLPKTFYFRLVSHETHPLYFCIISRTGNGCLDSTYGAFRIYDFIIFIIVFILRYFFFTFPPLFLVLSSNFTFVIFIFDFQLFVYSFNALPIPYWCRISFLLHSNLIE